MELTKSTSKAPPKLSIDRGQSTTDYVARGHGEDTPAYQVLLRYGLVDTSFRVQDMSEGALATIPPNSNPFKNTLMNLLCCPCGCCFKTFTTPSAHLQLVEDGRGGFKFYEPGVHLICDPFYKVNREPKSYWKGSIEHGDNTVVVVDQGKIGFAVDKGQPVLLPPGLHTWRSATMRFVKQYDLNNNVIVMGPLTLITVDAGYCAVTENNGKQEILTGGDTYLLTHRNWKFQKFISQKIQSNNLKQIRATSADNVLMAVDATVIWRIENVEIAALNSAETISKDGGDTKAAADNSDIKKLSNDVLKQAEASLAAFIGSVNYSDSFNVAAAVQDPSIASSSAGLPEAPVVDTGRKGRKSGGGGGAAAAESAAAAPATAPVTSSPLFDPVRVLNVVRLANEVTCTYGVKIISINVVAAVPDDKHLMNSLAQGAVAAAEATKYETVARGKAAAVTIEANAEAEARVIRARGERAAADLVEQSDLAVKIAMLEKTGGVLHDKTSFFFGADPSNLGQLLVPAAARLSSEPASGLKREGSRKL